jgi:DNA-binding response OmpR family regulator
MGSDWKDVSVLIVDDNRGMRQIVASMLKGFGITSIREAPDADRAVEILHRYPIDLVICDYVLGPGQTGIDVVRRVRASDSPSRFTAVIMLTGHSSRVHVREARDAGANEFMTKPVTAQGLTDRINSILKNPRPFVRSPSYFGPDRRRRQEAGYPGPFRRSSDPPQKG